MVDLPKKAIKFSAYAVLASVAFVISLFVSGSRYGDLTGSSSIAGIPVAHADAPACGGGGGGGDSGGGGDGGGCGGSGCGSGGDSGSGSGGDSGGGSDCL